MMQVLNSIPSQTDNNFTQKNEYKISGFITLPGLQGNSEHK